MLIAYLLVQIAIYAMLLVLEVRFDGQVGFAPFLGYLNTVAYLNADRPTQAALLAAHRSRGSWRVRLVKAWYVASKAMSSLAYAGVALFAARLVFAVA